MKVEEMLFSVSMCVYGKDEPEHFQTAVESVVCQTVPPTEIVLVADGPVPEALDDIIKKYESDERFHVIRLPENRGHGNARRIGLENCKYDLVALMDADDISVKDRFAKQLACFSEDESLTIVGGNIAEFVGHPENTVGKRIVPESDEEIKKYMKKRCPMNQVTVMFRKQDILEAGGYLDWYGNEDYYLWVRLFLRGKIFYNIQEILVNVRVGAEMYQRRGGKKYFASEAKLQKLMLNQKMISAPLYVCNVLKRLIVQVLLPNKIRGWVFRKFAREKV